MSPSPCWTLRGDEEMLKMFGPEGPSVAAVGGQRSPFPPLGPLDPEHWQSSDLELWLIWAQF